MRASTKPSPSPRPSKAVLKARLGSAKPAESRTAYGFEAEPHTTLVIFRGFVEISLGICAKVVKASAHIHEQDNTYESFFGQAPGHVKCHIEVVDLRVHCLKHIGIACEGSANDAFNELCLTDGPLVS